MMTLPRGPLRQTLKASSSHSPVVWDKRRTDVLRNGLFSQGLRVGRLTIPSQPNGTSPRGDDRGRTPARGTPRPHSYWLREAGSACVRRKCSSCSVRPAGSSGRRGPWFQSVGSVGGRDADRGPLGSEEVGGVWSAGADRSFGSGVFTATSGGSRGLVEPVRRGT